MNEHDLVDLLDRLGHQVVVTPPPVGEMLDEAAAVRRRRLGRGLTGTLVLSGVVAVVAVSAGGSPSARPEPPAPSPTGSQKLDLQPIPPRAPAGYSLVGVGHASISVPEGWGVNETRCGTPRADTVVINPGPGRSCVAPRPPGISDVVVLHSASLPTLHDFADIVGVRAGDAEVLRTPVSCWDDGAAGPVCRAGVYIESEAAAFIVTAPDRDQVTALLDSVAVRDDAAAVPDYPWWRRGAVYGQRFIDDAEALGLWVDVSVEEVPGFDAGDIVAVSPPVGTVLALGQTVHLIRDGS